MCDLLVPDTENHFKEYFCREVFSSKSFSIPSSAFPINILYMDSSGIKKQKFHTSLESKTNL